MTGGLPPAAAHARVAAEFTARVRGVPTGGWDAPAPVSGWVARDVVRHLVTWLPGLLADAAAVDLPPGPDVDVDPVGAWLHHCAATQRLLDDPDVASRVLSSPHLGVLPLAEAVDRVYTPDVFLHTWDLARATGQDERLDPETCRELYEGMVPMEAALRASGHYGARVEVPDDADIQTRLLGFIGRRP